MLLLALLGAGCPAEVAPRNCQTRTAYYPDADGDGYGEPTDVFIGCEAPPGWVSALPPPPETVHTGTEPTLTGDTGPAPPTGDTGPAPHTADTGPAPHTADTGPAPHTADTGPAPTTGDTGVGDTAADTGLGDTAADTGAGDTGAA